MSISIDFMTEENTDEFGEKYFAGLSDSSDEHLKAEHELVLKLMKPLEGERILDVGCGRGRLGDMLTQHESGIEMVSSDVTDEAKKYVSGTFVRCSMAALPFPDEHFDKIFCLHVIAHFKEGQEGINEAYRVLKGGGRLMVITPNKYFVYYSWLATLLKHFRFKYDRTAKWLYSRRSLAALFRARPWSSFEEGYFQSAPRRMPFEWMRAKLVVVAVKGK